VPIDFCLGRRDRSPAGTTEEIPDERPSPSFQAVSLSVTDGIAQLTLNRRRR